MIISKRNFVDYTLLLMVIAISGIPYFTTSLLYIPVTAVLLISFLLRKNSFDKEFIFLLIALTIVTVMQTYEFSFFSMQSIIGVYLRVVIGYLIVKLLNDKFTHYYINILYYFAVIGIIFFILTLLSPMVSLFKSLLPVFSIFNIANSVHETLIVYNISHMDSFRNSGPFWEPGAFGGYLILAIIFLYFQKNIYNQKRKLIVLVVALLSTFSTTGFLALAIFLFFYYYKDIQNVILKILLGTLILYGAYFSYHNLDFLGKKLEYQLAMAKNANAYGKDANTQRFLNTLRDIEDFKGHELFGRGSNPLTRYAYKHEEQIRTVGLTDVIVRNGFLFFLLMIYFMYKSVCAIVSNAKNKKSKLFCYGSMITILTSLMSEVYFNFPLYWSLLFIFLVSNQQEEKY